MVRPKDCIIQQIKPPGQHIDMEEIQKTPPNSAVHYKIQYVLYDTIKKI